LERRVSELVVAPLGLRHEGGADQADLGGSQVERPRKPRRRHFVNTVCLLDRWAFAPLPAVVRPP
jgi:hypothetical protein